MTSIENTFNSVKKPHNIDFLDEISNFIFTSKYSRYQPRLERRETWYEAVKRLELMHLKKYSFLDEKDKEKIKWAFDLVREKRVVPSMRSLQYGGKAIEVKNERLYNCAVRHIDSLRSFAEVFFLLLCGNGVGLGLTNRFLNRLPDLVGENDKNGTVITYVVQDTIEGWADAVQVLLNCYFKNNALSGRKIVFDFSKIRPAGETLKTGGGKAPGYKGLKRSLSKIKELLDHIIEDKKQNRLLSINAYDILMHCSDAVLSGGVRRSATCVIFDKDDELLLNAKTYHKVDKVFKFHETDVVNKGGFDVQFYEGKVNYEGKRYEIKIEQWELEKLEKEHLVNWWHLNPQRARSNNSVLLIRETTSLREFTKIVERTKQFGEPGFVFSNEKNALFNPCFEVNFIPVTQDGVCGVQFCNLTSMNGRLIDTKEKFKECCEASAIIGTLQAGYTNFPYLSNAAQQLTEEEALLGCSITGMMDNPEILLDRVNQNEMSNFIVKINKEWAKKIGINQAARTTLIKPEGTSSLVLGCGSGIHPHHARRYFRRVQMNKLDNVLQFFNIYNDHLVEESVWSANKTDDVITFPIEVSDVAMVKSDLNAIEHLEIIKETQINWVLSGTTEANKKNISHNVSCTVIVKPEEWEKVIAYLYKNRQFFAAVSLLPASGDKDYPQAPMEAVVTEEDEQKWNEMVSKFSKVPYTKLKESEDDTNLQQEGSCYGGQCEIIK